MENKEKSNIVLPQEILDFIPTNEKFNIQSTIEYWKKINIWKWIYKYKILWNETIVFTLENEEGICWIICWDWSLGIRIWKDFKSWNFLEDICCYIKKEYQWKWNLSYFLNSVLIDLKNNHFSWYQIYIKDERLKDSVIKNFWFEQIWKNRRGQSILIKYFEKD